MSLQAGESERIFHIAFMTSSTSPSLALTPAFREPDTICKLQLPISTSFGSSLSSFASNFSSTAQFLLAPCSEVGLYLFLKGLQCFLLLIDTSYLYLHDP